MPGSTVGLATKAKPQGGVSSKAFGQAGGLSDG